INGAAFATVLAISIYNSIKIYFVKRKFNMMPFTKDIAKVGVLLIIMVALFYFWEFPFHPLINIALKSILISVLYVFMIFKMNVSEDLSDLVKKYILFKKL